MPEPPTVPSSEGAVLDLTPEAIRLAISRIRRDAGLDARPSASDDPDPRPAALSSSVGRPPSAGAGALRFGDAMEVHEALDSTMDVLAAAARAGAPAGSVVVADFQRAGRGRLKRAWLAPPGTALMLSMLFRPSPGLLPPERTHELGMAVGLAAYDLVRSRLPAEARTRLKWPNDLLVDGRKIAGLLAEASWDPSSEGGRSRVVVGVGLNVRQAAHELPEGATSLAEVLRTSGASARRSLSSNDPPDPSHPLHPRDPTGLLDRSQLAAELLVGVERWVARLQAGTSLVPVWSERLETLGRRVVARRGDERLEGVAEGVDADGALRIRLEDGRLERLHAGDVTLAPV